MLNKKKPIEAADIEKAAQEIERKKAALLKAENELGDMMRQAEREAEIYNAKGIVLSPHEIAQKAEIKRVREQIDKAAEEARNRPPKPPFIPNPYLIFREKTELAEIMRWGDWNTQTKDWLDKRHKIIYDFLYENLTTPGASRIDTAEKLIEELKKHRWISLDSAGGGGLYNGHIPRAA